MVKSKTVKKQRKKEIEAPIKKQINKLKLFLNRRPHRTFRRTRRRDYARSLNLPGYLSFSKEVWSIIWKNKKVFGSLALVYALFTALMVGIASQDTYKILSDTLKVTGDGIFSGGIGELGKASLLFVSAATGGISQNLSDTQQIYAGLILLIAWMTSIWLLRNTLAGHKVKFRDGLYSASSPLIATFVVAIIFMIQLLPFALALIAYGAASATGLLAGGIESMLFWIAIGLLLTLSLYWVTSTFFALIIVTLPGMYPFKALKTAGDLVVGRRLRILLRIVWMSFVTAISWALIMIPIILLDKWVNDLWPAINWIPTIPILLLILTSVTIVWISSYIYLLYRKVVADEASPA